MISEIGTMTGFKRGQKQLDRARRLTTIAAVAMLSLIIISSLAGWVIHREIMITYTENYHLLMDAGITDIVQAPQVVSDRMLVILSVIPLLGAGIVFPLIIKAAAEVRGIVGERDEKDAALRELINRNV